MASATCRVLFAEPPLPSRTARPFPKSGRRCSARSTTGNTIHDNLISTFPVCTKAFGLNAVVSGRVNRAAPSNPRRMSAAKVIRARHEVKLRELVCCVSAHRRGIKPLLLSKTVIVDAAAQAQTISSVTGRD